jgi:hypothetical protein
MCVQARHKTWIVIMLYLLSSPFWWKKLLTQCSSTNIYTIFCTYHQSWNNLHENCPTAFKLIWLLGPDLAQWCTPQGLHGPLRPDAKAKVASWAQHLPAQGFRQSGQKCKMIHCHPDPRTPPPWLLLDAPLSQFQECRQNEPPLVSALLDKCQSWWNWRDVHNALDTTGISTYASSYRMTAICILEICVQNCTYMLRISEGKPELMLRMTGLESPVSLRQ